MTIEEAARLGSLNNLHAHDSDYYDTILVQRGAPLAFEIAADDARKLRRTVHALMTAIKTIEANCLVWQTGESEMSAGDFLALIQREADEAMKGAKP